MNEEEKKEYEELKSLLYTGTISQYGKRKLIEIIEKQSKEIEELKNEVMEKELIIDGMKEDRRIAVEEIQEQYYISKDKIKAKIEEVDKDENASIPDFIEYAKEYATQKLQSLLEEN
jgi:hypothetical protein